MSSPTSGAQTEPTQKHSNSNRTRDNNSGRDVPTQIGGGSGRRRRRRDCFPQEEQTQSSGEEDREVLSARQRFNQRSTLFDPATGASNAIANSTKSNNVSGDASNDASSMLQVDASNSTATKSSATARVDASNSATTGASNAITISTKRNNSSSGDASTDASSMLQVDASNSTAITELSAGVLSVAAKHYHAYYDALYYGYEVIAMLEDDVAFNDSFPMQLSQVICALPTDSSKWANISLATLYPHFKCKPVNQAVCIQESGSNKWSCNISHEQVGMQDDGGITTNTSRF